ncbi:GTP-binding protein [Amylibacter marinus]|uniref:GTP-binding protein n=1 Tax=Amylibacter marinus TaxID=1475483 RepID=A0ABQ5VUR4_9RHOB|nr:MOSC domain-containing protein [Amylibacter marinus]GLQ35020.1 GTP-binding protein [Amylibacter marinus]
MGTVTNLWRHPIKGVGCEPLTTSLMIHGQCMPMDRHWALAHSASKADFDNPQWARCLNFARGARTYSLMAVTASLDETSGEITLNHPDQPSITLDPEQDEPALIQWVRAISDPDRVMPERLYKADRGLTDSREQTVSILSNSSLSALGQSMGMDLDQRRFRGNIWLDGLAPWQEFDLVGQVLRIGSAEFDIIDPIERCMATTVNPDSGTSDAPTLATLERDHGHRNFGIFGVVRKTGTITLGDTAQVIS